MYQAKGGISFGCDFFNVFRLLQIRPVEVQLPNTCSDLLRLEWSYMKLVGSCTKLCIFGLSDSQHEAF